MQAFVEDIKSTKSASNFSIFDTDKAADWSHVKKMIGILVWMMFKMNCLNSLLEILVHMHITYLAAKDQVHSHFFVWA